jgi:inner membrane protein
LDNLTHSLFGLTLARTPLGRAGRGTTVALLLASNAPDIDILATAGGAARYLQWHRGPTHGPLGVIGLAFLSALLAWLGTRWWDKRTDTPPASLLSLWLVSIVGILCHVLMDLPTSYGTRLLSPFVWTWFAKDWMPIVDIYLLGILAAGLFFGRWKFVSARPRGGGAQPTAAEAAHMRARTATIALLLMLANYGVRATAHHMALAQVPTVFGTQLPPPCTDAVSPGWVDHWPRVSTMTPRDQAADRCLVEIAAMPDFMSPFKWRLIAQMSNAYELRDINLLDSVTPDAPADVRLTSVRYPNQWTPAVVTAARTPTARVFLGFSRFPAARSSLDPQGNATVRWADMRFVVSALGEQQPRRSNLFGVNIRVGADGTILSEHLGP